MFVVTIEQGDAVSDHWVQCASYVAKRAQDAEQAMYEALYRWVQDSYHGSTPELLEALGPVSAGARVTIYSGDALNQLKMVEQKRIIPRISWCVGRHNSERPVHCAACDWYGSMKQMVHKYRLNSQQEIEPADFCPECNAPLT